MLKEELRSISSTIEDIQKFSRTVGGILILLGIFFWWRERQTLGVVVGAIGAILVFLGLIYPSMLRSVHRLWMSLAVVMGWFMSRFILVSLFYIIVTPLALLARVLKKEFLHNRIDKTASSYWELRKTSPDRSSYERQY